MQRIAVMQQSDGRYSGGRATDAGAESGFVRYHSALGEARVATVCPEDQEETDGSPEHGMRESGGPGYQGSAR